MLFDPKWNKHSVEALIAWLENKPQDEKYDFLDPGHCLAAQYFESIGQVYRPIIVMGHPSKYPERGFEYKIEWVSIGGICGIWSFGAALERARSLLLQ